MISTHWLAVRSSVHLPAILGQTFNLQKSKNRALIYLCTRKPGQTDQNQGKPTFGPIYVRQHSQL